MVLGLFAGVLADVLPKRQTLLAVQVVMMVLAIVLTVLTATGLVEVWMIIVLALLLGLRERGRHAGPPGVRDRDGRSARRRQCRGHQLGDVQRRPRRRAGRRRPDDRGVRDRAGLRDQRR